MGTRCRKNIEEAEAKLVDLKHETKQLKKKKGAAEVGVEGTENQLKSFVLEDIDVEDNEEEDDEDEDDDPKPESDDEMVTEENSQEPTKPKKLKKKQELRLLEPEELANENHESLDREH